jgi:hypothetical protein
MTRRRPIPLLFALSTFGCVIEPGVLEGGNDEVDDGGDADGTDTDATDTDDGTDTDDDTEGETGDALLAECLQGTNPDGGIDAEDFPVGTCAMTCDQGWAHESTALPIAWTLHFEALESDDSYFPIGVVPRSGGDGVVVVSRRDGATELSTVSSEGAVLGIATLPTELWLERLDAGEGVIYLAYLDEDTQAGEVMAIDEAGELLWSKPQPGRIESLAAIPGGGVIVGGSASLTRFAADGSISWTAPSITALSLEVSAMGTILVGGHEVADPDHAQLVLYSDLGAMIEMIEVDGSSARLWDLHFLAERRLYASGTEAIAPPGNGSALVIDLDDPELGWTREYNRALDSCDQDGALVDVPTWDWFGQTALLSDGTLLIAGAEAGPAQAEGEIGLQPRILHIDQQGEFLAGDRGLWFGQASVVAAGDDGSAYAAMTIGGNSAVSPTAGFHLRKYEP